MRNPNILLQRRRSSVNLNNADDNLLNRRRSSIGMAGEDLLQHFNGRRRSSVLSNGQLPSFNKPNPAKRGTKPYKFSPPGRRDSLGSFQICRGTCCSRLLNMSEELNVPIHAGFGRCCRRVSKQLETMISDEACARRFTIVTVSMFLFIFCVIGFSVYQRLPKMAREHEHSENLRKVAFFTFLSIFGTRLNFLLETLRTKKRDLVLASISFGRHIYKR